MNNSFAPFQGSDLFKYTMPKPESHVCQALMGPVHLID